MPVQNLVSLDPDQIQASLIQFLKSQTEFSDYDFTGSGLNVLLTLLSFNTSYFGYYLNMVAKEMFLDSAQLRDSVISLAKQLNYTPTSSTSATATVTIVVTPSGTPPAFLTLNKNTPFNTSINGTSYNFVTRNSYTVPLGLDGNFTFPAVIIREGNPYVFQYTVNSQNPVRYIIPSALVDTTTLNVTVQDSQTNTTKTLFSLAGLVADLDETSPVYYLQEIENGFYEVYFGNDVLGISLNDGNVVNLDYVLCAGSSPNKASTFTSASAIGGYSNIVVNTVTPAFGGEEPESLDSIRFNAPKVYESQNRAVTENDYASLIQRYVNNIQSLVVWGGEKYVPPINGKVFISIQPSLGYFLTQADKDNIINVILGPRGILNITPEIIDPNYIFLVINSLVKYKQSLTNLPNSSLSANILNTITNFNSQKLNNFNASFLYSMLVTEIDQTDPSVISNLTSIQLKSNFIPILNKIATYSIIFGTNNPILPGTVSSTSFVVNNDPNLVYKNGDIHYFDDDTLGTLRIYKIVNGAKIIVKAAAGSVDYTNGIIKVVSFIPTSLANNFNYISMTISPVYADVVPSLNNIITINPIDVNVNLVAVS